MEGQATHNGHPANGRKKKEFFSRRDVRVLRKWVIERQQHPYPSAEEKEELL